jgi:hypothetical protein
MPEQSIGMATGNGTQFGDGNFAGGGYPNTRLTAMETKTLSDGVLQVGSLMEMTGVGTGTLTIADGAAIVGGYFYENTTSSAIVVSSLSNATYKVAILVNNTAGTIAVSRSVSGTTTSTYSVRLAVASNLIVSNWNTAGYTYLEIGNVTVSGSVITSIVPFVYTRYGNTTQFGYQAYATMSGGTATLTTANTQYDLAGFSSPTVTADGIFTANNTAGTITVLRAGMYLVTGYAVFGSGTTGNRVIAINVDGTNIMSTRAASSGSATHSMTQTGLLYIDVNQTVKIGLISSIATQTVTGGLFNISRV